MQAICLHNKDEIEAFLRQDPFLHLYELGDLTFFWHHTTWYALKDCESIQQLVLFYTGSAVTCSQESQGKRMEKLLRSILHLLPTHTSVVIWCACWWKITRRAWAALQNGTLASREPQRSKTSDTFQLSPANIEELNALYRASYPGIGLSAHVETGYYYGIRRNAALVGVAGCTFTQRYKVRNITVHPNFRGQGLGTILCARLCQALLPTVETIGLNVKADNTSAICCYTVGLWDDCRLKEYSCFLNRRWCGLKKCDAALPLD